MNDKEKIAVLSRVLWATTHKHLPADKDDMLCLRAMAKELD